MSLLLARIQPCGYGAHAFITHNICPHLCRKTLLVHFLWFQYDFEGRRDLVRFVKEVKNASLFMNLRIGPYISAEWNFGFVATISLAEHTHTHAQCTMHTHTHTENGTLGLLLPFL